MQAQDIIQGAMRLIGQTGPGRTAGAAQLASGLSALNLMLDAWNTERLMVYATARTVYALNPGQQVYTIGPSGADWTATRPQSIDAAGLIIVGPDASQTMERALRQLTLAEWAGKVMKGVTSTLPTEFYFENDYPAAQLVFWPSPTATNNVALYTTQLLTQIANLTDTVSLPPGYADALRYGLAVRLAPEYGVQPSMVVIAQAEQLRTTLKRQNTRLNKLRCDFPVGSHGGHWDYLIGCER